MVSYTASAHDFYAPNELECHRFNVSEPAQSLATNPKVRKLMSDSIDVAE